MLRPVYSDTTQLNSARRRVELSWVGEVSIATPTQFNSTRRRVVDTFTAWTTVTDQFGTSWPGEGDWELVMVREGLLVLSDSRISKDDVCAAIEHLCVEWRCNCHVFFLLFYIFFAFLFAFLLCLYLFCTSCTTLIVIITIQLGYIQTTHISVSSM